MFVKRISLIVLAGISTVLIIYITALENFVNAFPDGISGFSGSPSTGGNNCSNCHFVASTSKSDLITLTNDIPTTGYLPNVRYNFTLSILSKQTRAGFNVRLEDAEGNVTGTISNLDSLSRTEGGELTHTIWTGIENGKGEFKFTWTAPSTGDTVKLFAMAATSPRDGTLDTLNSFEYVFGSAIATSLSSGNISSNRLTVTYEAENLRFKYTLDGTSQVQIYLYNSTGGLVKTIYEGTATLGEHDYVVNTSSLKKGVYLARMVVNGKVTVKKIMIGS